MKKTKWFDRKFDFSYKQNIFPSVIERLEKTPLLIKNIVAKISNRHLIFKENEKWSVQENIGHLIDLEPIWQGRLDDILGHEVDLRSVDLENKKTDLAKHNEKNINDLLDEFLNIRLKTIKKLKKLTEKEVYQSALHPRLKTPMRTMDLFLFVAEHDEHHLLRISDLVNTL